MWSLMPARGPLTPPRPAGSALSLTGVLVILLHGDLTTLSNIELKQGDLIFTVALRDLRSLFGAVAEAPKIHGLSFVGFTFGCALPA